MSWLGSVLLRALGWMAWLGQGILASIFLAALVIGTPRPASGAQVVAAAIVAALVPTFVMMLHLDRSQDLHEDDRLLWRMLLLWGGPVAGAAYLTSRNRRISGNPFIQMLRMYLG
jgi:hypothetical protein